MSLTLYESHSDHFEELASGLTLPHAPQSPDTHLCKLSRHRLAGWLHLASPPWTHPCWKKRKDTMSKARRQKERKPVTKINQPNFLLKSDLVPPLRNGKWQAVLNYTHWPLPTPQESVQVEKMPRSSRSAWDYNGGDRAVLAFSSFERFLQGMVTMINHELSET